MKCSCCGKTLLSTERFCPNCGQNNDDYVEPKKNEPKEPPYQSTVSVPSNNNQTHDNVNQYYPQDNYQQQQYIVQTQSQNNKCASASVIKVFMLLGCILSSLLWLVPLLWTIPMTIHAFGCLDRREKMTTGFKVCSLLFCSLIAGIIMLCDNDA